jgi:PPE-repeat protein
MDFAMLPPETNSGRIYAGPGSAPMRAAAAAWEGMGAELRSTAASYVSVLSELTSGPWLGPSSATMAAAAVPYVEWMITTATQAEQAAAQASAAAAAYETAFTMTVPPPVIAANRSLLMTLVATNILGQNTPAIAATEADYAEMWGQDATAMYGYAASSAAASALTPFTPPPPTTNPAGTTGQAATAGQSITSNGSQLMSAVPQTLQELALAPAAADPADTLTELLTLLTLIVIPLTAIDIPIAATSATASTTSATASFTSAGTTYRGLRINADRDFAQGKGPFTGDGPGGAMVPQWILGGPNALTDASSAAPVAAGMGRGARVAGLSVPSGWASAAPAFRPIDYALPITGAQAAPEVIAGSSGNLLSSMALAAGTGGAVGSTAGASTASLGRTQERSRENPTPPQPAQGEPIAEIAAELRELAARAQSLLTKLADSGLMTAEDVTQQRQRFLGS